jgi:uncharacterized iron-regulated protein
MNTFVLKALILCIALLPSSLHAGQMHAVRFSDNRIISIGDMIDETLKDNVIIIGEYHGLKSHHEIQLELIRRIRARTPDIAIGLEMFPFQDNPFLEMWTKGKVPESELIELFNNRWSFPFSLYKEIFDYARVNRIPLIGLNVPRSITMKVSEEGFSSLTEPELSLLPSGISCNVTESYREFIRSVLGSHSGETGNFENFCEAQMLWDQTMASVIADYIKGNRDSKVIALTGMMHAWKPAIPFQIKNMGSYNVSVILPDRPDVPKGGLNKSLLDYMIIHYQ